MLIPILAVVALLLLGSTLFFGSRVANAVRSKTESEKSRDRLQNDLKKAKERLSKAEKKIKSSGSVTAKDDKKLSDLKSGMEDLRRQLAESKKAERSANRRADTAEQAVREVKRDAEATKEESMGLRERLRSQEVDEDEGETVEVVEEAPQEEVVKQTEADSSEDNGETRESRREAWAKREIDKLSNNLSSAKSEIRQLQRELGTSRRKSEHQRRAYLVTQRQLELAQDLLEVMEADSGTTANAVLLEKSQRAKKRHEIRQDRAKSKAASEMPPQLDGPVIQIPDPPEEPPEPEVVEPEVEPVLEEVQQVEDVQDDGAGENSLDADDSSSEAVEAELPADEGEVAEVHHISEADEPERVELAEGDSVEVSSTVVRRRRKAGSAEAVEE